MTMLLLFVVHNFLAGFAQFYYMSTRPSMSPHIAFIFCAVFFGGIYFLGWWSVINFFIGGAVGSKVYLHSIREGDL